MTGNHKKVVLFRLIPAYLTEWDTQAFGAHSRGLFEYGLQVRLSKRKSPEYRQRFLPAQQFFNLFGRVGFIGHSA